MTDEHLNTLGTLVAAARSDEDDRIRINRTVVEKLISALREARAEIARMGESAAMSCESPCGGCAGCQYAEEQAKSLEAAAKTKELTPEVSRG